MTDYPVQAVIDIISVTFDNDDKIFPWTVKCTTTEENPTYWTINSEVARIFSGEKAPAT